MSKLSVRALIIFLKETVSYLISIRFSVLLITLLFGPALAGAIQVKVGVYQNEPKIFTSKSGKPSGIFIDIIEYIAQQEDWELIYVSGTWEEGLRWLDSGEIDIMPDVGYTSDREKQYLFTKTPVLSCWSQVFAKKGSNIRSILDINGKRIAVLRGSIQQIAFERLTNGFGISVNLLTYPDFEQAFNAVAVNEADAAVTNNFYGLLHAKPLGLEDTSVLFDPSSYYIIGRQETSTAIITAIDKHLDYLKKAPGSIYYSSLKKWTSERVKLRIPFWLIVLVSIVGTALVASIVIVFIFKKMLRMRTRELRESNHEMENRIIERTSELEKAMEMAKDADRLKSAFLATMSHELRTPLNSIIGFTGILLQELAGPLNDEQKKQLGMVQNSSRHLLSLINDVLDISKIEAGQLDLFYEKFSLRESISRIANSIQPAVDKKGIELRLEINPDVNEVYCDQRRLEQIIINLLSNAVKFTEQGYVRISTWLEGNNCIVSVKDCGIGIKEEQMQRLFIPFSQIDSGLSRKYEGTGLGLSICKKLITMLNGSITVASKIGKGSTFTISFPLDKEV